MATGMHNMADGTFYEADQALAEKDAEIARLRAEVEAYRKDAERYRWLRDEAPEEWDVTRWLDNEHQEVHVQDYLDEAIDAAMGASA